MKKFIKALSVVIVAAMILSAIPIVANAKSNAPRACCSTQIFPLPKSPPRLAMTPPPIFAAPSKKKQALLQPHIKSPRATVSKSEDFVSSCDLKNTSFRDIIKASKNSRRETGDIS